jgi:hypothetical protein
MNTTNQVVGDPKSFFCSDVPQPFSKAFFPTLPTLQINSPNRLTNNENTNNVEQFLALLVLLVVFKTNYN